MGTVWGQLGDTPPAFLLKNEGKASAQGAEALPSSVTFVERGD